MKVLVCMVFLVLCAYATYGRKGQISIPIMRRKQSQKLLGLFLTKPKPKPGPPRTNDSISLSRFFDDQFYTTVNIGHPAQKLNMALDPSWSMTWVLSSQCQRMWGCLLHRKYDNRLSSSYKKDGRPFQFNTGRFVMKGFYSYDNISISHSNVTGYSFVEMRSVPHDNFFNRADGVLGLGRKYRPEDNPFFYTLLAQKKIKNPVFSIYLNRDIQSTRGGNVMLGFIEPRHIHHTVVANKSVPDAITYLNVDRDVSYWQFPLDRIIVNATKNPQNSIVLCNKGCKAIVDTTSNSIVGPKDDIDQIHLMIGATELVLNRYAVSCDSVPRLPPIIFGISGKNFTLKGQDYIVKLSYDWFTICLSAFSPADTDQEQGRWSLGAAFLSAYYSIYNVQELTIGFVKAA